MCCDQLGMLSPSQPASPSPSPVLGSPSPSPVLGSPSPSPESPSPSPVSPPLHEHSPKPNPSGSHVRAPASTPLHEQASLIPGTQASSTPWLASVQPDTHAEIARPAANTIEANVNCRCMSIISVLVVK